MESRDTDPLALAIVKRTYQSDFFRVTARPEEREALAKQDPAVGYGLSQDYLAWRRGVLWVASALLFVAAVLQAIGFETMETQLDALFAPAKANQVLDESSLDNLEALAVLPLLAAIAGFALSLVAALTWDRPRSSRRFAAWGWILLVATPLVLALVPWSSLVDFQPALQGESEQAEANRTQVRGYLGLVLGLWFFTTLGPKVISLFAGIVRSALTIKTLIPQTPTPGWIVAAVAPVYILVLLLLVSTINQFQGGVLLTIGILGMIAAQSIYLFEAKALAVPSDPEGGSATVTRVRWKALVLNVVGILCIAIHLFSNMEFPFVDVLSLLAAGFGGLFLMTAVFSDLVLSLLQTGFRQGQEFHGTELAKDLDERLAGLSETGVVTDLSQIRLPGTARDD